MFARALIAFLVLPGTVAFLIPLAIVYSTSAFSNWSWPAAGLIALGLFVLLWCVRDFYVAGKGTLAPWAPPRKLVVVGLYRFVRNPMYVGVVVLVFGWTMAFRSFSLAIYCLALCTAFHLRVVFHEEPWLSSVFGQDWSSYRGNVNRWFPRVTPWRND